MLWTLKAALDPNDAPPWPGGPSDTLFFLVPLLLAAGLAGFYFIYKEKLKGLGQTGFTQGVVGLGLLAGGFFGAYTLGEEPLLRAASFGFFILAFGLVLIGYGAITEDVLGRWNWLPLAIGAVAPLGILIGSEAWARVAISILFGAGWVLFGILVWRGAGNDRVPPADARVAPLRGSRERPDSPFTDAIASPPGKLSPNSTGSSGGGHLALTPFPTHSESS